MDNSRFVDGDMVLVEWEEQISPFRRSYSVGIFLNHDGDEVTLADSVYEDGTPRGVSVIPKGGIRSMVSLRDNIPCVAEDGDTFRCRTHIEIGGSNVRREQYGV